MMAIAVTFAAFGSLAACGGGSGESATPSSLPLVEPVAAVDEGPVTSTTAPEASEPAPSQSQLTPEMFEGMLETDAGRSLLISSIAGEVGIDPEEAGCLLDAIPVEILVEAAGSFLGGEVDGVLFAPEQVAQLTPLLDSCGIDVDVFVS